MAGQPIRLKYLLRDRHWQTHRTFCIEYDKAAEAIDPALKGTWPSRTQLHRWLSGDLKGLPYPDHCRILETMLPGWSAAQMFEPHMGDRPSDPIPSADGGRWEGDGMDVWFPARLRELMQERGISLRALARHVPMDAGQLSRIMNDKWPPSEEFASRCDEILGTGDLLRRAAIDARTLAAQRLRSRNRSGRAGPAREVASGTRPPLSGPPGDNPSVWNITPAVQGFRGRDCEIDVIERCLRRQSDRDAGVAAVAVYGIAGVGKTQLARAFADIHKTEYQLGWWLSAETHLDLMAGLSRLAVRLGADQGWSPGELLHFVSAELSARDSWLLVFDNATTAAEVEHFIPRDTGGCGHVLLTSRSPSWRLLAEPVAVDVLDLDDATALLSQAGQHRVAAQSLAQELGQLPLAIGQAAAYTADTNITFEEYLALFRRERARLLDRGSALAYPGSVCTSVALALDRLAASSATARRLVEACALCSPDPLPLRALLAALRDLSGPPEAGSDAIEQLDVLKTLRQSGLLTLEDDDCVRIHRLTRVIIEDRMDDYPARVTDAVALLAAVFPTTPSEPGTWTVCAQMRPHAAAVFAHARRQGVARVDLASLLSRVGRYLLCSGLSFPDARDLHDEALRMRRRLHVGDHPETARCIVHLAVDLNELGDTMQARHLHQQALEMRRRLYPGDHPDLAHSLDNLGNVLHILGHYDQAKDYHEQGLAMRRRLHPDDHPNLAYSLSNLAADLHQLGDLDQARSLNEAALAMRRRLDPGDHPDIAHSLTSLAAILHALGDYDRAIDLEGQALEMRRRLYPAGHPNVVKSLLSIADNHRCLGHDTAANQARCEADQIEQKLTQQWARPRAAV